MFSTILSLTLLLPSPAIANASDAAKAAPFTRFEPSDAGLGQTCDDINDRVRRSRFKAGEVSARAFAEEAKAWNRAAKLRDAICVADSAAAAAAALAAGFRGKIVYKGTREAANLISNGASRC